MFVAKFNKSFGNNEKKTIDRFKILSALIFILALGIVFKLIKLQIFDHNKYTALAKDQQEFFSELLPNRGQIFIKESQEGKLLPLATNRQFYLLYAVPSQVVKPREISEYLADFFEADKEKIFNQLIKEGDVYEPLIHKVDDRQKGEIEKQNFSGIKFMDENWRYYPENNLASQVLGFVGYKDDERGGMYGLEGYFQKDLVGIKGATNFTRDAVGRLIPVADNNFQPAEDGIDLVLTLDRSIQYVACTALERSVQKHGADSGTVVIMDPRTGAIMAMCNYPDFDPNNYNKVENINYYNNQAIFEAYEPGSIFKPLTMAAAIDLGRLTPETTYEDTGEVKIAGFTINNYDKKAHGIRTMTQVLEDSLNTGAIFAAQKVGDDLFKKYVQNFGFGKITGITLQTENSGDIRAIGQGEIYTATASFGQGLTVTPLQMVVAYGALANEGKLLKPYIIQNKIYPDGRVEETEIEVVRQVISPKTALTISGMLASVIKNGYSNKAEIDGYYVAGKTGTAQIADLRSGEYDPTRTNHTFIAYAPLDEPRFVVLTKLENPKSARFAESTAIPLFQEIGKFLVNYLQIPKEKNY